MTRKTSSLAALAILVLAIGGTAWFFLTGRMGKPLDAVALVPAETVFLIEARDVTALKKRLNETALADFLREPGIARIVAPLRSKTTSSSNSKTLSGFAAKLQLKSGFLAQVSKNQSVALVGGFEIGVSKTVLNQQLKVLHEALGKAFEIRQEPFRQHNQHAIFAGTVTSTPIEIVLNGKTCFFSSDPAILDQFLDRFDQLKPKEPNTGTLANLKEVAAAIGALPDDWDVRVLLQPGKLAPRVGFTKGLPSLLAMTSKIDRKIFRDAVYAPGDFAKNWPVLTQKKPLPPNSVLDLRLPIDAVIAAGGFPTLQMGPITALDEIARRLRASSVTREDWKKAFGPEVRLGFLWPKDSGRPVFQLTCEVRDTAGAREVFKRLGTEIARNSEVRRQTVGDREFILVPSGESLLYTPAMTLEPGRLRIVSNLDDMEIIDRESTPAQYSSGNLSEHSARQEPASYVAEFHVESSILAGRAYQLLRPVLTLTLQMMPGQSGSFDWTQLPDTEVVTRHLQPLDITLRQAGDGILIESSGLITLPQMAAASWIFQSQAGR